MRYEIERRREAARPGSLMTWARTRTLMLVMLASWIGYFLVVHLYIASLNKVIVPIVGLPLGVYLPIQGALAVFAVALFSFRRLGPVTGQEVLFALKHLDEIVRQRIG